MNTISLPNAYLYDVIVMNIFHERIPIKVTQDVASYYAFEEDFNLRQQLGLQQAFHMHHLVMMHDKSSFFAIDPSNSFLLPPHQFGRIIGLGFKDKLTLRKITFDAETIIIHEAGYYLSDVKDQCWNVEGFKDGFYAALYNKATPMENYLAYNKETEGRTTKLINLSNLDTE